MNKKCDGYISPFRFQLLQSFPYIVEDFDQYTNYQLFCKLVEKVNEVVGNENEITKEVNDIKEYLETLDLQDEVNNKLDEMAESGELQEIIASYLNANALWCFDNVQSMKSATNLINGSYAKTLGFNEKNDGGSALYKIRTITNNDVVDNIQILALNDNTLIAELIITTEINAKQFGAKGDGVHNDTTNLQTMLNIADNSTTYQLLIGTPNFIIPTGKYLINEPLEISGRCNIDGQGSVLLTNTAIESFIEFETETTIGYSKFENITFNGNSLAKKGMITTGCLAQINNCYFINFVENGILSQTSSVGGNVKLTNCRFYNYIDDNGEMDTSTATENCIPIEIYTADSIIENCVSVNFKNHIVLHSYPCFINMCHGYNFKENLLNCNYIKTLTRGGFVHIEQTECDTIETFIDSSYSNCTYYLSNCHYFIYGGASNPVRPIFNESVGNSTLTATGLLIETNGYTLEVDNFNVKARYLNCFSDNLVNCGLNEGFGINAINFNLSGYVASGDIVSNNYERLNDLFIINTFLYFNSGAKTISSDYTIGKISGYNASFRKRFPVNITSNGEQKIGILQIETDGTAKLLKNDLTITAMQISIILKSL